MKYSLLLAPDRGFIFVEAKPPRRPASVKVSTQQNTGRPVQRSLWNVIDTTLRGTVEKHKDVGDINTETRWMFAL